MSSSFSKPVQEKLDKYSTTIIKWNKAYNLLSASQQELWDRHILDSTQIFEYLPQKEAIIVDLGSGAGLPAIPCAIIAQENNIPHKYIMVESVSKKTSFLEEAARILALKNVAVKNERIENLKNIEADVVSARAFAKIIEIFHITKNIAKADTKFVLLKGKNIDAEIAEAQKDFSFDYQLVASKTGDGFIFIAENLKQI